MRLLNGNFFFATNRAGVLINEVGGQPLEKNSFPFMVLQDVQPLTNFLEKRVREYSNGMTSIRGSVSFTDSF